MNILVQPVKSTSVSSILSRQSKFRVATLCIYLRQFFVLFFLYQQLSGCNDFMCVSVHVNCDRFIPE